MSIAHEAFPKAQFLFLAVFLAAAGLICRREFKPDPAAARPPEQQSHGLKP
jgi:hypothetical protein